MIGESPTLPGIFHARPLVVVTPETSPFTLRTRQLIVPAGGWSAICHAQASAGPSAAGKRRRKADGGFPGGASRPSVQLLWPPASRSDRFHTSHASLDFSV